MVVKNTNTTNSIGLRGSSHNTLMMYHIDLIRRYWITFEFKNDYINSRNDARGFRIVKLTKL